jgi:hypothetical protein
MSSLNLFGTYLRVQCGLELTSEAVKRADKYRVFQKELYNFESL